MIKVDGNPRHYCIYNNTRLPVNVFLTVDTEVWPRTSNWRDDSLNRDIQRDIYGCTPAGDFGIRYQMDVLNASGLKAVFFLEGLFADAAGSGALARIVTEIQQAGHEVQLHVHPEWLEHTSELPLSGNGRKFLRQFTEDEQALMIGRARRNLELAGATGVCAFRAGSYGADPNTLRALARNGIRIDSSYHPAAPADGCGISFESPLLQPRMLGDVWEFPVSFFEDWPSHIRPLQLCACSSEEIEHALLSAWRHNWYSVVLVSHSFELLRNRKGDGLSAAPARIAVRRFEKLCQFLARHQDRFQTRGFADVSPGRDWAPQSSEPVQSNVFRTACRYAEQLVGRFV